MMNVKIYMAEDERMAAEILEIAREACPAARLIGRRYEGAANWGEWWENGWFETLEKIPALPFNGDAYIGARREAGVHWIGMLCRRRTMPCASSAMRKGARRFIRVKRGKRALSASRRWGCA